MNGIIESIAIKDYDGANSIIEESLHYIIERKMVEKKKMIMAEKNAWNNMPSSRQEKLYRDVLEMDASKMPADHSSIEDRRKEQAINSTIKTNFGGEQEVSSKGKGNLNPQTPTKELKGNNQSGYSKSGSMADVFSEETEELEEARIKIVKARIRGGVIQRRKKVSNVPGMTLRGGQLKRMSAAERRRRKLGQRKGKMKRKAKMARTLMKRQRSLRRRKSLGI